MAVRIGNGLHRGILGNAARKKRRKESRRLPILICKHDRQVHPHFHILVGAPKGTSQDRIRKAMRPILRNERFSYPNGLEDPRCCAIEHVRDLKATIFYNSNVFKSLTQMPIAYISFPTSRNKEATN